MGLHTISMTGINGEYLIAFVINQFVCRPVEPSHIQEMHIAVGHMICGIVEEALSDLQAVVLVGGKGTRLGHLYFTNCETDAGGWWEAFSASIVQASRTRAFQGSSS